MKHVHHDCIVAWANGATIEVFNKVEMRWVHTIAPMWYTETKYRIQQKPKQKIVLEAWLSEFGYLSYEKHPRTKSPNNLIEHRVRIPEFDKEIEIE